MTGLRVARAVRSALALVLIGGAAAAGSPVMGEVVYCSSLSTGNVMSMSCVDAQGKPAPETEAGIRARILTPGQARAAGCEPVEWDDGSRPSADDLYASLLRHDGADGNWGAGFQLPMSQGLSDLDDIFTMRSYNCRDLVMEGPPEAADPEHGRWHGSLLPFAATGKGRELFIDPRTGRVGESTWNENLRYDGPMGWPSYLALLEAVADSMEKGTALRDWYPAVTSGCELRWADEPADLAPSGCAGAPRPSPTPTPTAEPTPERLTPAQARASGCRPARRPPVVRSPDPAVASRTDAVWRRIERWLARRAPATYRTLQPPARVRVIAKAEAAMGRPPDPVRGRWRETSPGRPISPCSGRPRNPWRPAGRSAAGGRG
ncbi:hypothetical protein FHR32_005375 [Streptosporangium album]|uniref:Knr4/Smi1-like domain-containing protein n=1 Tax=Streptosporangium album TaxID=47479 RepID=A0A7W7RZB6_9ACTN|nr:hypothetical protein [Streptosporangium album]MBB4940998.1 hypothetical protein [Streptosporangium album]